MDFERSLGILIEHESPHSGRSIKSHADIRGMRDIGSLLKLFSWC